MNLLIKQYFLASLEQRHNMTKNIIDSNKDAMFYLQVLYCGASGKYKESYQGAVNLLAEIDNSLLLNEICECAKIKYDLLIKQSKFNIAENYLDVLITAIACAYKINVNNRINLLVTFMPILDTRILKSAMIDNLGLIADELDNNVIKTEISKFLLDKDIYIVNYAKKALLDL